jgi:hypothetical protein
MHVGIGVAASNEIRPIAPKPSASYPLKLYVVKSCKAILRSSLGQLSRRYSDKRYRFAYFLVVRRHAATHSRSECVIALPTTRHRFSANRILDSQPANRATTTVMSRGSKRRRAPAVENSGQHGYSAPLGRRRRVASSKPRMMLPHDIHSELPGPRPHGGARRTPRSSDRPCVSRRQNEVASRCRPADPGIELDSPIR